MIKILVLIKQWLSSGASEQRAVMKKKRNLQPLKLTASIFLKKKIETRLWQCMPLSQHSRQGVRRISCEFEANLESLSQKVYTPLPKNKIKKKNNERKETEDFIHLEC